MENSSTIVKLAIASTLAIAVSHAFATPTPANAVEDIEKCYGVAKAGQNDCQTNTHACAGTVMKDRQPDAFVLVPKGTCDKLAGGSTSLSTNRTEKQ